MKSWALRNCSEKKNTLLSKLNVLQVHAKMQFQKSGSSLLSTEKIYPIDEIIIY